MNHSERVAYVARQRRRLTRPLVSEAVELYLEALAEDIAAGDWVELPGIGRVQVSIEQGSGKLYAIQKDGQRLPRKPTLRLRTRIRLSEVFKARCRRAGRQHRHAEP
jgi:hypothetical protein